MNFGSFPLKTWFSSFFFLQFFGKGNGINCLKNVFLNSKKIANKFTVWAWGASERPCESSLGLLKNYHLQSSWPKNRWTHWDSRSENFTFTKPYLNMNNEWLIPNFDLKVIHQMALTFIDVFITFNWRAFTRTQKTRLCLFNNSRKHLPDLDMLASCTQETHYVASDPWLCYL